MPRKAKQSSGTVEFVNKPEQPSEPSILPEVPKVDVPEQGTPTNAPAPPPAPKAKRPYTKRQGAYWEAVSKNRKNMMTATKPEPPKEESPKNEIVHPEQVPDAPKKRGRPRKVAPTLAPPSDSAPVSPPVPVPPPTPKQKAVRVKAPPKPKAPPKVKAPPKPKAPPRQKKYQPLSPSESEEEDEDEEEDEEDEEDSEEEEEPVIQHVAKKAVRRLKTLDKIDKRIKELSNSYSARGYSVF